MQKVMFQQVGTFKAVLLGNVMSTPWSTQSEFNVHSASGSRLRDLLSSPPTRIVPDFMSLLLKTVRYEVSQRALLYLQCLYKARSQALFLLSTGMALNQICNSGMTQWWP